ALGIALLSVSHLLFLVCFSGNRTISDTGSPDRSEIADQTRTMLTEENRESIVDWRMAVITVVACSFVSGSLEGAAFRLLAPLVGVSLFLTAGVVGVVLSGMALGNFVGGRLASGHHVSATLRMSLVFAGTATVMIGPIWKVLLNAHLFGRLSLIAQTVCWSLSLFFIPSLLLGTITPQVIQIIQRNTGRKAELAGRLCAWSTLGCICGILATSWILIEQAGAVRTCILCGFVPLSLAASRLTSTATNTVFRSATMIRAILIAAVALLAICRSPYLRETQYFAISVSSETMKGREVQVLSLDRLVHSVIDLKDPGFLHYPHEHVQGEIVRWAAASARKESRNAKVLIIGGGGYSLPRWIEAQTDLHDVDIDVVEIDPEVTAVAHEELGLPTTTRISSRHLDGRQFVRQTAAATYDLVIQDAVNDFCVPSHLMTKEYNQLIRRILRNDGVYLLTVIDSLDAGLFVSSAAKTMDAAFPATRLLIPRETEALRGRSVFVIASRNRDGENADSAAQDLMSTWWSQWKSASVISTTELQSRLSSHANDAVLLTDDYAPVDQLMIRNFLH
ncbi:MAG: fused MFS/spermidine synthase, partial [Planctomycetota bacterium]